jgi:hypothetical protein
LHAWCYKYGEFHQISLKSCISQFI